MQQIFHEFSAGDASSMTNDSDSGLISGVKILGLTSRNGRVYPPEVLREAAPLYEGARERRSTSTTFPKKPLGFPAITVTESGRFPTSSSRRTPGCLPISITIPTTPRRNSYSGTLTTRRTTSDSRTASRRFIIRKTTCPLSTKSFALSALTSSPIPLRQVDCLNLRKRRVAS